jgi:hypothetical protein
VDITQRFGFWFVIAGISGQIVRTEYVKDYDLWATIAKTSPIYVHVTAYLECFKQRSCVVVNESIVFYKSTHTEIKHWQKTAEKLNVFDEYFWTLGYIRQLEYLESKAIIDSDYLRYMLETNEFSIFRPVFVIADKLLRQLQISAVTSEKRNKLTYEEYHGIRDYLFRKDPFIREFIWLLDALFEKIEQKRRIKKYDWYNVHQMLNHYRNDYIFSSLLVGSQGKYEIFRIADRYYAIEQTARDLLIEYPRFLDKQDMAPIIFFGNSVKEVKQNIMVYEGNSNNALKQNNSHSRPNDFMRIIEQANHKQAITSHELAKVRHDYEMIRRSTSWRITAPMRICKRILRRYFKR